jgi:hypothetical protein
MVGKKQFEQLRAGIRATFFFGDPMGSHVSSPILDAAGIFNMFPQKI